jgi:hypothetical protein
MDEFPINKINSFREKRPIVFDKDKRKALLSLNYDSIFLKKIIETKEKQRSSIKKLFDQVEKKSHKNLANNRVLQYESVEPVNNNPTDIKNENISKEEYKNKKYLNLEKNIKEVNLYYHKKNRNKSLINKGKNNCYYYKLSNNIILNNCNSPINYQSRTYSLNKENTDPKMDYHYLSFNGRKIFATSTFKGLNDKNNSKSSLINNENSNSELYRNYFNLKEKQEQIYKRKMRKAISSEKKEILKIKSDKELKEETINIKSKISDLKKREKFKIIPIMNNENCFNKTEANDIIKNDKNNKNNDSSRDISPVVNNYNNNKSLNNFSKSFKINKNEYLYISKEKINKDILKKMKDNLISKKKDYNTYSLKTSTNNNIIKNKENNEISNNKIKKYERPKTLDKTIDSKIKHQKNPIKKAQTPDRFKNTYIFKNPKKNFVEDNLYNSLYISEDKLLNIEIHSLQNVNQIFSVKKNNMNNLQIQKIINVYLGKCKKIFLNYLKNSNKSTKYKKKNRINFLSSIKEEEEKSKTEITKSGSKIEEQEKNIYYNNQSRFQKICELKKKILMPDKKNIREEIKTNKDE